MLAIIGILTLLSVTGIHYYLARRLHKGLVYFFPRLPFWPVLTVFLLLCGSFLLGFSGSMLSLSSGIKEFFNTLGMYWLGLLIYLLVFSLAAELVRLILRICKCQFRLTAAFSALHCVVVVTLAVITTAFGLAHVDDLQVVPYQVNVPGKADVSDMNIILISDLHLGSLRSEERLPQIVAEINTLKPDLICIAGDFFDTDFAAIEDPEQAIQTLQQLSATYGIYACLGNHDGGKTNPQMQNFLADSGISLLNEAYTVIDERLILVGRLDGTPIGGYVGEKRGDIGDILPENVTELPVVVMDHNPANLIDYDNRVDLILSGHTHQGQVFPANLITDLIYDVDYGYYRENPESPQIIVTSGISYWGMPMRVGTDCEIVQIQILP